MEAFLIKALQLILAFALLVTIHEFGHYIFARMYGMRVDRFYLFFNPWFSLAKYDPRKGTLQLLAWTKKKKNVVDGKEVEEEEPRAALYHLHPPAGGFEEARFPDSEDHAHRAGAL